MRYNDPDWQNRMRVRLDTNLVWADRVGARGIPDDALDALAPTLTEAVSSVGPGFKPAPTLDAPTPTDAPGDVADFARWAGRHYDSLVILADPSLARGMAALADALLHPYWNLMGREARVGPRLFFVATTDPEVVSGLLDILDPAATLFVVADAAGNDAGPLAEFLVFRRALMAVLNERYREHVAGLAGPQADVLRVLGRQEGFPVFDLPAAEHDVLHPSVLLPVMAAGVDGAEIGAGAAYAHTLAADADPWRNPALMGAALHWLAHRQGLRGITVAPQAGALESLGRWLADLWVGTVTGQREGEAALEADASQALVDFLTVGEYRREAPVPELRTRHALPTPEARAARDQVIAGIGYLGGTLLSELRRAETRATALTLAEAGRPSLTYRLPEVNPFTVGQLIALWQMQRAYAAVLFGGSPDTSAAKTLRGSVAALANRPGAEERRRALLGEESRARDERMV